MTTKASEVPNIDCYYWMCPDEDGYAESLPEGYANMEIETTDPTQVAAAIEALPDGFEYMFTVFEYDGDPSDMRSEIINIQQAEEWLEDYR